jgi:uncharacterized lipoprotein YmbA
MRRGIYASLLMAVVLLLAGCSKNVDYQPPLDIPAATYVSVYKAKVLEPFRIEDITDPDLIITSPCQDKIYKANLSAYGKALKATLEREFVKNGFQMTLHAEKVIRIDVIDVEMAWPKMPRCDINVVIGIEGQRIGIATNAKWSTSIDGAIDAAIADAASRILSHQEVVAYLTNTL